MSCETESADTVLERMRIHTNGNVGIGTSSPTTRLEVAANGSYSIFAGNAKIGNLADPTLDTDAATKSYVDTAVSLAGGMPSGTTGQTLRHDGAGWVANSVLYNNGTNVGIGATSPTYKLQVTGTAYISSNTYAGGTLYSASDIYTTGSGDDLWLGTGTQSSANFRAYATGEVHVDADSIPISFGEDQDADIYYNGTSLIFNPQVVGTGHSIFTAGNVGIGTSTPAAKLAVTGNVLIDGNLTLSKLTASTIDPLYRIKGVNYSTFAPSIVGGVREEYVGRIYVNKEATIDFDKEKAGSDLWVWRQVVDFNRDNVEVLITPYGQFAQTYYLIKGNKIIFRSDRPVEISYRLVGKRFDWVKWPTLSQDQETPGYEVY